MSRHNPGPAAAAQPTPASLFDCSSTLLSQWSSCVYCHWFWTVCSYNICLAAALKIWRVAQHWLRYNQNCWGMIPQQYRIWFCHLIINHFLILLFFNITILPHQQVDQTICWFFLWFAAPAVNFLVDIEYNMDNVFQ